MHDRTDHPETRHIDAVLEPIAPSSRYEFVEIEQGRIPFASPLGAFPRFIRHARSGIHWLMRTQWKTALGVLVMVMVAELSLRAFEPRLTGRIYDETRTGGHPRAMNEQGFRGAPVQIPKPAGTTRILALGDSVTFGTGIASSDTWSAQLGGMLRTPEHPVEVINTALPAADLGQIELEVRTRWASFQPDQAVLVVTGNMVSFAYARRDRERVKPPRAAERQATPETHDEGPKARARELYARLALPGALIFGMEHLKYAVGLENHDYNPDFPVGVMLAHGYAQASAEPGVVDEAWSLFADQLARLKETLDTMGVPLTVVYAPPRFMLSDRLGDNLKSVDRQRLTIDPIERTRMLCQRLGIAFIDPRDALRDAPTPVYALSDYTHFERSGHRALAQLIADSLRRSR